MNLQFFANKNIILHPPKQDGTMDTDTNLYPQTKVENIIGLPPVPTKTSDLTNDSGFITSSDVPTKTSDLTNDSGFITSSYHDSTKQDTLVNQTNIKSINGQSILGSGDLTVGGGGVERKETLPEATSSSPDLVGIGADFYFKAEVEWDEPIQTGDELEIRQAYSANQTGDELNIE